MKNMSMGLGGILAVVLVIAFASSAFAWDDDWEIKRSPYGGSSSKDIEMRQKYNYDPGSKYRGTIDNNGSTRMRNYNGDTLRGNIDKDGYGRLRDEDGNSYRVRPE